LSFNFKEFLSKVFSCQTGLRVNKENTKIYLFKEKFKNLVKVLSLGKRATNKNSTKSNLIIE